MKFYKKSLIYKNTTLYDIDFPQKIGILRFFLRKFLLTVLHIFHRKYTPNFQKIDFSIYPNILYIYDQNFMLVPTITTLYDIDFPQKIGILRFFFFKKVSIDGFTHFSSKIHPKFSKIDFSIYPNILYIYDQNFMLVPTIKLLEFCG